MHIRIQVNRMHIRIQVNRMHINQIQVNNRSTTCRQFQSPSSQHVTITLRKAEYGVFHPTKPILTIHFKAVLGYFNVQQTDIPVQQVDISTASM
jgi:hypothetical protein